MKERNAMKSFLAILTLGAIGLAATFPGSSTIPEVYDLADNGGSTDYFDVEIDQFDPALGTLQSVEMTFFSDWKRTYQYENESTGLREGPVVFDDVLPSTPLQMVEVIIGSHVAELNEINVPGGTDVGLFTVYDGTLDFDGSSGTTDSIAPGWDTTGSVTITNAGALAALTGTGTFEVDLLLDSNSQAPTQCSNCTAGISTLMTNVVLIVSYNYN